MKLQETHFYVLFVFPVLLVHTNKLKVLIRFCDSTFFVFTLLQDYFRIGVLTKASVDDALQFAKTVNAYAVHPNVALLSKRNVSLAQGQGYKVFTWTVNDDGAIQRMASYGVDAIISDNPDKL